MKVKGEANPYDLAWELYFEERLTTQMASTLTGRRTARYLWLEQYGQCPVCRQALTLAAGWHMHHLRCRVHTGGDTVDNLMLLHPNWHRHVLMYNLVAKLTGLASVGLGQCLEPIQCYCLSNDLERLTSLVVSEKSGMPGFGFIAAQDIPRTQQQVFSFDWVVAGCPTPEQFERAVRDRPSNDVIQAPED